MIEKDERAIRQWNKSDISYINYSNFISNKSNKFKLTLIDLLYVSNFKGGYATINEPEETITEKLVPYGQLFKEIDKKFNRKNISHLNKNEMVKLIEFSEDLIKLTDAKSENKIDGFSVSFLTTLLHFYFPNLYPILDRRVLNGLKLIKEKDLDKQGQVRNLKGFYATLIEEFKNKIGNRTIREFDKELFTTKFQITPNEKHENN